MNFVEELINMETHAGLFNPYTQNCDIHDKPDASNIRLLNIASYFEWLDKHQPDGLIIAEAYGWRGGRRTGLPFTDDLRIENFKKLYKGIGKIEMATTVMMKENSAGMVWEILEQLEHPPAMWNIIPLQVHEYENPFSIRTPNTKDYKVTNNFTIRMMEYYEFKKVFAVGRKAQIFLKKYHDIEIDYIRHPSHGGKADFSKGMFENFN